jgi:hypothetical protein
MPRVAHFKTDANELRKQMPQGMDFEPKEPGFTLDAHSDGELQQREVDMIFGQISSIMQVAIYEMRDKAIGLEVPGGAKGEWLYFAKP